MPGGFNNMFTSTPKTPSPPGQLSYAAAAATPVRPPAEPTTLSMSDTPPMQDSLPPVAVGDNQPQLYRSPSPVPTTTLFDNEGEVVMDLSPDVVSPTDAAETFNTEEEGSKDKGKRHQAPRTTVDGRTPALATQRPPANAGFPPTHGLTTADIYRNINRDQLAGWLKDEDANCLVDALGVGSTDTDLVQQDIRALLSGATNAPPNSFRVSAPSRASMDEPPPTTFLISGLPQDIINNLVENDVLATNQLHGDQRFAIRFTPLNPPLTDFLGLVTGLSLNKDEVEQAIEAVH
ncbi:hypothetical protein AAF712_016447 [Marasmius tenuissimus]|uniref:Uncharacterized protein n=1 Tax=Marasmius tenuissimus TaxID=585030 RepID=A0ABR2Z5X3_9AGAR